MLDISGSVLSAFSLEAKSRLVSEICIAIWASHARLAKSPEDLAIFVATQVDQAAALGLESARTVGLYTLAAFLLGDAVIQEADVPRRLAAFGRNEEAKSQWLAAWLSAVERALS